MGNFNNKCKSTTKNSIKSHHHFPSFQSMCRISVFILACFTAFFIPSGTCHAVTTAIPVQRNAEFSTAIDAQKNLVTWKEPHLHPHSIILAIRGGAGSSSFEAAGDDDDNLENPINVRLSQGAKNTSTSTKHPPVEKIEKSNDARVTTNANMNTSKWMQTQSLLHKKQGDTTIPAFTDNTMTSVSNTTRREGYTDLQQIASSYTDDPTNVQLLPTHNGTCNPMLSHSTSSMQHHHHQQQQHYPIPPPPYYSHQSTPYNSSTDADTSPQNVHQPSYIHSIHPFHQSQQLDQRVTHGKESIDNSNYQQRSSSSSINKAPFKNTHSRNKSILSTTGSTVTTPATPTTVAPKNAKSTTIQHKTKQISFDSLQKILYSFLGVSILSCCAISPRTADFIQFQGKFKENMWFVALVTIPPILFYFLVLFDDREKGTDINSVLSTFYSAFTTGYLLSFLLEIFTTTLIRLAVFRISEPQAFDLVPQVPLPLLPWTLRENKYRPKRITIFAADFLTSCVASAIIEEYVKLKVMQWTGVTLPKNFVIGNNANLTSSAAGKKGYTRIKKKRMMVPVCDTVPKEQQQQQQQHPQDVTSISPYVSHMAASSLGLKLADSIRRALMYTKPVDSHKVFYALCRGIFPIHELCGILTALQLAKRDVLGIYMPVFKIIFPAVFVHGMANFRGKKPVFKWSSSTPWLELQMSPWNVASGSTMFQILKKGFAKFMWLSFLGQVLGHCVRNFYMISRQAANRTSTCTAGKQAFSDEIKAAEKGFAKFMWLAILGRVAGYCIQNYYMISHQSAT